MKIRLDITNEHVMLKAFEKGVIFGMELMDKITKQG